MSRNNQNLKWKAHQQKEPNTTVPEPVTKKEPEPEIVTPITEEPPIFDDILNDLSEDKVVVAPLKKTKKTSV